MARLSEPCQSQKKLQHFGKAAAADDDTGGSAIALPELRSGKLTNDSTIQYVSLNRQ